MARLRDKQHQIPNGFVYVQPETGFDSKKAIGSHPSFDRLVDAVLQHRLGNPRFKSKWKTDRAGVEYDVEIYNVKVCESQGWTEYLTSNQADAPPKAWPLRNQGVAAAGAIKKSTTGIKLVVEWLGSGLKPESIEIANQRAAICSRCPQNEDGSFFEKIGAVAAKQVKDLIEVRNDMDLKTDYDAQLKSCKACACWLPLKVFSPSDLVLKNTSDELRTRLDPACWILKLAN